MTQKKSILIVGASGFIGSNLVRELSKSNDVLACGRSLKESDIKGLGVEYLDIDISKDHKTDLHIDCIVNCIANTNTQGNNWESYYDSNCLTTYSLLNNFQYKRFIQLSTFSVLDKKPLIYNQRDPRNYYGLSKYIAEKMVEIEHSAKKVFSIIRFPIVIGKKKTHKDFIDYIFDQSKLGGDIELYNGGQHLRDLIHISEAVKAIISTIHKRNLEGLNIFNVGSSDIMSSYEICEYILKRTNSKSKINFTDTESNENVDRLLRSNDFIESKRELPIEYESQTIKNNINLYLNTEF